MNNRLFKRFALVVALTVLLAACASTTADTTTTPTAEEVVAAPSPSASTVPTTAPTATTPTTESTPTTEAIQPTATAASTATAPPTIDVPTATAISTPTTEQITAEPTATVDETATTAATATAEISETPIVTPTVVVGAAGGASGCVDAHAATPEESIDLNPAGQQLAPALDTFNQYRLDLDLNRENNTITGRQTLVFTNRTDAPLPDLLFHLYPNLPEFEGELEIACASIDGRTVETQIEDGWLLRVPFEAPLAPGATASVNLHWTTTSPRNAGTSAYGAFNAEETQWALASFYPQLALRLGDAWDTLRPNGWGDFVNSDMALYHAQIRTPEGVLATTGRATTTCDAGTCASTVAAGPQRDFTIVLLEGWQQERRTVDGTEIVSSFPAEWREAGLAALELSADSAARYNQAYGAYPYTELDVVPIPAAGFAGVEYPGLIMISETFYQSPANPLAELQSVVVHEVAHMWWYNIVGNDVLREPWLDEGITSYTEQFLYPELSGRGAIPNAEGRIDRLKELGFNDDPIDLPVADYGASRSYVAVIYARAPLFPAVLRSEVGDEAFFDIMQEYYRRYAFNRATTADFAAVAEEIAGRDLDAFFVPWFGEDGPGAP